MKIAAIQMCSSHRVDENLMTAGRLVQQAAQQGAKLVVLPEMFAIMGLKERDRVAIKEPFGQGKIQTFLAQTAQQNHVWLVGGTIPLACDQATKVKAACLVYNDQGQYVARYDKIHLFDVTVADNEIHQESSTIVPGEQPVVIDTPVGKLGLGICYDLRFPELFRYLVNQGAEIIALPAAFTAKTGAAHWDLLTRCRAVENLCYVVGACQGGTHSNGRKTYGHSLIVEPWGTVVACQANTQAGIVAADIDLKYLQQIRTSFPTLTHQKPAWRFQAP